MIGQRIAHYTLTGEFGRGGMGEVYRARDTKLGREVAIKVPPAQFSRNAQSLGRFEREAKALAALNHPNVATDVRRLTSQSGAKSEPPHVAHAELLKRLGLDKPAGRF